MLPENDPHHTTLHFVRNKNQQKQIGKERQYRQVDVVRESKSTVISGALCFSASRAPLAIGTGTKPAIPLPPPSPRPVPLLKPTTPLPPPTPRPVLLPPKPTTEIIIPTSHRDITWWEKSVQIRAILREEERKQILNDIAGSGI